MQLCFIGGSVWCFGWWFWKMGVSSMQGINHTWKHFLKQKSNRIGDSLLTQDTKIKSRNQLEHFHFVWNFHNRKLQHTLPAIATCATHNCSCSSSSSSSSSRRGWSAPWRQAAQSENHNHLPCVTFGPEFLKLAKDAWNKWIQTT